MPLADKVTASDAEAAAAKEKATTSVGVDDSEEDPPKLTGGRPRKSPRIWILRNPETNAWKDQCEGGSNRQWQIWKAMETGDIDLF